MMREEERCGFGLGVRDSEEEMSCYHNKKNIVKVVIESALLDWMAARKWSGCARQIRIVRKGRGMEGLQRLSSPPLTTLLWR